MTTITDDSWKKIVKTSLESFQNIPSVLVHRLKAKIRGTAADGNYTAATLLENLLHWVPLIDEPFGNAPQIQHDISRDTITSSDTPTSAPSDLSQVSDTDLGVPTPEPSTSDHTPDELEHTTKEWAEDEFKNSGFLISVPSPDEWLDTLPTDSAVVLRHHYRPGSKATLETSEVDIDIDELLTMTETNFVKNYIATISEKTNMTSRGWLEKTAKACQERLEYLMIQRKEGLGRRRKEREGDPGTLAIRVVRHWIAVANLTAAEAAIERLSKGIVKWDRQFEEEEGVDSVVASINSPRASASIP